MSGEGVVTSSAPCTLEFKATQHIMCKTWKFSFVLLSPFAYSCVCVCVFAGAWWLNPLDIRVQEISRPLLGPFQVLGPAFQQSLYWIGSRYATSHLPGLKESASTNIVSTYMVSVRCGCCLGRVFFQPVLCDTVVASF
jgi:hypothetical protein